MCARKAPRLVAQEAAHEAVHRARHPRWCDLQRRDVDGIAALREARPPVHEAQNVSAQNIDIMFREIEWE